MQLIKKIKASVWILSDYTISKLYNIHHKLILQNSFSLAWLFYGISTLVGYLMLNLIYTYISIVSELFVANLFKQTRANLFAHS